MRTKARIMPQFLPFRGVRYDPNRVEISRVLCPPYDVIKGAAREQLLARDPHNFVAIELAARYGEAASDADYQKCAHLLKSWRDEGIFTRDDSAFYVYEQEFLHPQTGQFLRRRGVLGALTLEEFGQGVLPHENTLSGPKIDRLKMLRALRANTSPIFGVSSDDDGWIHALITDIVFSPPHVEARDDDGITHRLWVVTDDETVNGLVAAFENEQILIADGHHRYETALQFWRENGEKPDASSSVMMFCASSQDSGLVVLPTHRVVLGRDAVQIAALPEVLAANFEVEKLESLPELDEAAPRAQIGLLLPDGNYRLTPRATNQTALDVEILHREILENELGIGAAQLAGGAFVKYTIHAPEAQNLVQSGAAQAAFLLRATPVSQIQNAASAGRKMPQKSTYFYPKLITGMVLRHLD